MATAKKKKRKGRRWNVPSRDVEVSVSAPQWTTSKLCEAYAFWETSPQRGEESVVQAKWNFMDALLLKEKEDWKGGLEEVPDRELLEYSLSLRAHSPFCEMHQSLATADAAQFGVSTTESAFALVVKTTTEPQNATSTPKGVVVGVATQGWEELEQVLQESSGKDDGNVWEFLPDEKARDFPNGSQTAVVVVLYGSSTDSQAFRSMYQGLAQTQTPLLLRFFSLNPDAKTMLQGYGARIDIRNLEYRAFDDDAEEDDDDDDEEEDATNATTSAQAFVPPNRFLAGVNLAKLVEPKADSNTTAALQDLTLRLGEAHAGQLRKSETVPPQWQRRYLSLQAAWVVVQSSSSTDSRAGDPLWALQDVCQNLPSLASSLVELKVPDSFSTLVQEVRESLPVIRKSTSMESVIGNAATFALYVNGRRINVERPSFNVFELLNVIREEDALLGQLEKALSPTLASSKEIVAVGDLLELGLKGLEKAGALKTSSSPGDSQDEQADHEEDDDEAQGGAGAAGSAGDIRIDVGRGYKGAVLYLNDIERDPQYRSWPRKVQNVLFAMQYGSPPSVRRNLFTFLLVMDPTTLDESPVSSLAMRLVEAQYPARIGLLVVSQDDLDACRKGQAEACPTSKKLPPVLSSSKADLSTLPATARSFFDLLQAVQKKMGGLGALSYLHCMLEGLQEKTLGHPPVMLNHVLLAHVDCLSLSYFSSMDGGSSEETIREEAMDVWLDDDPDVEEGDVTYAQAVQFALTKNIDPGMSFLNGVPIPPNDMGVRTVFGKEQQHIMGLIAKHEITDTGPKSIYAMLLTGDGVYDRLHPLLSETKQRHIMPSKDFVQEAMSVSASDDQDDDDMVVPFVVEAHVQVGSASGLAKAISFLSATQEPFSSSSKVTPSLLYNLIPRGKSLVAAQLAVLCRTVSSRVGPRHWQAILQLLIDNAEVQDLTSLVEQMPAEVQAVVKETVAACSDSSCPTVPTVSEVEATNGKDDEDKDDELDSSDFFLAANGHVYVPSSSSITMADVMLLLDLEAGKSRAVARKLENRSSAHVVVGTAVAFFNRYFNREDAVSTRTSVEHQLKSSPPSLLDFVWNDDLPATAETQRHLQVKVTAILDPLTEPTQRVTPMLRAFRDVLKLPLHLVLAPRMELDSDDAIPISSYYRFVAAADYADAKAAFRNLPTNHVLTVRMDVPEPWHVQQIRSLQDTDNLRCVSQKAGCGDGAYAASLDGTGAAAASAKTTVESDVTEVEYGLGSLLFFGQCYDVDSSKPPNGLQLTLSKPSQATTTPNDKVQSVEISADGSIQEASTMTTTAKSGGHYSDTLVMQTVGYWQLRANPGVWTLEIAKKSRGADIFDIVEGTVVNGRIRVPKSMESSRSTSKTLVMKDFVNRGGLLLVRRRPGYEKAQLYSAEDEEDENDDDLVDESGVINVFSVATGHLYERLLKIMMLSVTKRASRPVRFWLFENYFSPSFRATAVHMAEQIGGGCEVKFVTYKWPEWLRGQSEKQRIIWGYKILFLDVLLPLKVKKFVYVDADQVVRADLSELMDLDLKGAPYGYTPFCDSRKETLGYQFWRSGFWAQHLRGKPYHISALYVVDLQRFRRELVGDKLRSYYQQLSADPNSLSNLDQDLPNYAQHDVEIFSLPQPWLWCESWCSDDTKAEAKTIDLCNNPQHKENKVSMAKRVISGPLFQESWVELDAEVQRYEEEYWQSQSVAAGGA